MSNQSAGQVAIDLKSPLDMNLNKNTVREFQGFTKRNSPYINGGLSPLFSQKGIQTDVIKKDGKTYKLEYDSVKGGYIFNNIINSPVYKYRIDQKVITPPSRELNLKYCGTFNGKDLWVGYRRKYEGEEYVSILVYYYDDIYHETDILTEHIIADIDLSIFANNCVALIPIYSEENNFYLIKELLYDVNTNSLLLGETVSYSNNSYYTSSVGRFNKIIQRYDDYYLISLFGGDIEFAGKFIALYINPNGVDITEPLPIFPDATNFDYMMPDGSITRPYGARIVSSNEFDGVRVETRYADEPSRYSVWYNGEGVKPVSVENVKIFGDVYYYGVVTPVNLSNGNKIHLFNGLNTGPEIQENGNVNFNGKFDLTPPGYKDIHISILINNNVVSNISINDNIITDWLNVNTEHSYPYFKKKNGIINEIIFEDINNNIVVTTITEDKPDIELIYDRYLIIKGLVEFEWRLSINYTIYDIKRDEWGKFYDWNNRYYFPSDDDIVITLPTNASQKDFLYNYGSAVNPIYENSNNGIASAQFGVTRIMSFVNPQSDKVVLPLDDYWFNLFIVEKYLGTLEEIPKYIGSTPRLIGTTYPVMTDSNILFNPPITANYNISGLMYDGITYEDNFYKLIYSDSVPVLLYAYGGNIKNVSDIFFIQGQLYVIRNNIICAATIDNNMFSDITPVINKGELKYLGCTPLTAYFYSEFDRYIYTFSGDRNLQKTLEISDFTIIYDSIYCIDNNSLMLATNNGLYVINADGYIFCINCPCDKITLLRNGFAIRCNGIWNEYYYYHNQLSKEKVELKTSFYGIGNNTIGIIDTWYIRCYSGNRTAGKVVLNTTTITDVSTTTETQEFNINTNDWDSNGFIYIRYQPQYQRGIAVSLDIVSDFEVFELQASLNSDNTKLLSADYRHKVNTISNGI